MQSRTPTERKSTPRSVRLRATARTVDYNQITYYIRLIENKLNISKAAMKGVTACVDAHADVFPKAYKYTPYGTVFWMEKTAAGWTLTNVRREVTGRTEVALALTDAAKEAILARHTTF